MARPRARAMAGEDADRPAKRTTPRSGRADAGPSTAPCAAAAASRLFGRTAAFHRALLEEYDAENDAELAPTAEALARAYGDVRAAAEQLHQHPNTVRYRLRKAKAVLGMPDAPDREFAFLLGLIFLDRTNPLLGR